MFPLDSYCISIIDDNQNDLFDISSQRKAATKNSKPSVEKNKVPLFC